MWSSRMPAVLDEVQAVRMMGKSLAAHIARLGPNTRAVLRRAARLTEPDRDRGLYRAGISSRPPVAPRTPRAVGLVTGNTRLPSGSGPFAVYRAPMPIPAPDRAP